MTKKREGYGRKHTHKALTAAKSDYGNRAGEDGKVGATQIDETPQKARFAQAKVPRRKVLTEKEETMKREGYGRGDVHKKLTAEKSTFEKRPRGKDGKVAATQIDETPKKARFARAKKPRRKVLTSKEETKKRDGYGRGANRRALLLAKLEYQERNNNASTSPELRDVPASSKGGGGGGGGRGGGGRGGRGGRGGKQQQRQQQQLSGVDEAGEGSEEEEGAGSDGGKGLLPGKETEIDATADGAEGGKEAGGGASLPSDDESREPSPGSSAAPKISLAPLETGHEAPGLKI